MRKYNVFISHDSARGELASWIRTRLEKTYEVFLTTGDVDSSVPIGDFRESIKDAIPNTRLFLLLLEENANKSEHVIKEVALAKESYLQSGKPQIAVAALDGFGMSSSGSELDPRLQWLRETTEMKRFSDTLTHETDKSLSSEICDYVKAVLGEDMPATPGTASDADTTSADSLVQGIAQLASAVADDDDPESLSTKALCARILQDSGNLLSVAQQDSVSSGDSLSDDDANEVARIVRFARNAAATPDVVNREDLKQLEAVADLLRNAFNLDRLADTVYEAWERLGFVQMRVESPSDEPYVTVDMVSPKGGKPDKLVDLMDRPLAKILRPGGQPEKTLLPLLGTGVLQLNSTNDTTNACPGEVIRWDSRVEEAISERSDAQRSFLEELKHSRLDGRDSIADAGAPQLLSLARIALFDLGYDMTREFVDGFAANPAPITDWADHSVEIRQDALARILEQCSRALEALEALEALDHDLLGTQDLLRKLEEVRANLNSPELAADGPRLSGSRVEWITDTFWHAMVFNSAVYPRMDELALQVALVDASAEDGHKFTRPLRRLEPSAAVARTTLKTFEDTIARCVRRGYRMCDARKGEPHSARHSFYLAMASALMSDYTAWVSDGREDRVDAFPVTLVTTFDLELERALSDSAVVGASNRYHVALPVLTNVGGNRARLRWAIGTFPSHARGSFSPGLAELATPVDGWQWLDDLPTFGNSRKMELKGPLVLKINGSPLHHLPRDIDRRFDGPSAVRVASANCNPQHHAITLGEFDIFQANRIHLWSGSTRHQQSKRGEAQGLPAWLTQSLRREDRYWMLVGHRLIDWNSRMQLFVHMPDRQQDDRGVAINRWFDQDRLRILQWLGIEPREGDATRMVPWLDKYAKATSARVGSEG